ncbi:hypothetical protein Pan161_22050 [Gimesia algae]|uniref:Uncharacterized protein n=1 Tax=Gimesia algae TaxID=2527971 RepID=A0A517VC14_9PLAN|nr:hypothetical protein Pan161_22050 [Gimesia algae]
MREFRTGTSVKLKKASMFRFLVLILIACLVLPAAPVSGCECSQKQDRQAENCCCSKSAPDEKGQVKSCCCRTSDKTEKESGSNHKQTQCQKPNCHCQQTFSQTAATVSVKSIELAQQLRSQFETIDLTSQLTHSVRPAASRNFERHPPEIAYSSGEFCAHFCLWLI